MAAKLLIEQFVRCHNQNYIENRGRKADQISWSFYVVVGNCARRSDICPQANPLGGEVHIDLEIVLFMVFPAKRFKIMRSLI
ncbi:hypothetical protein J4462_00165 [Candidatus Pacearchaeota archaeon]|nr:hypothetical protein [Candidatus Pacearchaeota archaeon]